MPRWYNIVFMLKLKNSVTISVDPLSEMEVACATFDINPSVYGDPLQCRLQEKYDVTDKVACSYSR